MRSAAFAHAPLAATSVNRFSGGLALLCAMTVVVMFTNDSAREYLKVPVGSFHLIERDFFLYPLLGAALAKVGLERRLPRVGVFGSCALAIAGLYYLYALVGLLMDGDPKAILFHVRQVNYVLVCFPVVYFVRSHRDLVALFSVSLICVATSAVLTLLLAWRYADSWIALRNEFLWLTGGAHGQYFHVRLAGAFFFVIVMDCLIAMLVFRAPAMAPRRVFALLGIVGGAMVLTVLRSLWVGMVSSLFAMWLVTRRRARFFLVTTVLAIGLGAVLLWALGDTDIGKYIHGQTQNAWDADSIAVADRMEEHRIGLAKVAESPWFGHGLGATLAVYLRSMDRTVVTSFCHNSFLTLLIFFGVVGTVFLVGVFLVALVSGVRVSRAALRTGRRFDAAIAMGCVAGLVGLMASSVTAAALNYSTGFFFIGSVFGVLDRLHEMSDESGERP